GHHLVVASNKEAAVLAIHGQSAGFRARRERPLGFHFQLGGIDGCQFALVFDVDEDFALGVAGGELRLAVELNGAQHFAGGGVDGGRVAAASVESEDALGGRIVENGVGIFADLHFLADGLQRVDVEDRDGAFATVAGEAASEVGRQSDAVDARSVGDVANILAGVEIKNDDVGAARDVKPARAGI